MILIVANSAAKMDMAAVVTALTPPLAIVLGWYMARHSNQKPN